jgi:non-heme chloroperoxidase
MTAVTQPTSRDLRQPAEPTKIYAVRGGGGLRLHVREWGNADGPPVLFIHGWSQSHLCWAKQYQSALAEEFRLVAYDLRGHGMSEAPLGPEHYTDSKLWADDVAAIIEQLRLDRPVLVGWSYGGFIICDYVRAHGQDRIGAVDLVAGAVTLGPAAFGTLIGPGFLDHFADATADDLPTNIRAIRALLKGFPVRPFPPDDVETLLCSSMTVPAQIRANLAARQIDGDDVLRTLKVPLLVTHGRLDTVVLPAMADHVLATCPTAEPSWYEGVGHTAHLEQPERFNRELAALTRRVSS